MSKGILIIAVGHPFYGRMAFNLAVSLKTTDPSCNVALAHDGGSLSDLFRYDLDTWIDQQIRIPDEMLRHGYSLSYVRPKLFMYDLSPYDETIFLDADTIWLPWKPVTNLFTQLQPYDFTMANRGYYEITDAEPDDKYSRWCKLSEVKAEYGKGRYYSLHSEVVYFKRSDQVAKYFSKAKEVYDGCKISYTNFADTIPDELAFSIAGISTGLYPHKDDFIPSYWYQASDQKLSAQDIYRNFYLYSIGGNAISEKFRRIYDDLAAYYFQRAMLQYPYRVVHKKRFLKERIAL